VNLYAEHKTGHRIDPLAAARREVEEGVTGVVWFGGEEIALDGETAKLVLVVLDDAGYACWLCGKKTPTRGVFQFRDAYVCEDCWTDLAWVASGKPEPGEIVRCPG
jgi:hypothetical protein